VFHHNITFMLMMFAMATPANDNPLESLAVAVERVTVVGTAAIITPGEFVSCGGWWVTDRSYGLQFKTASLQVVPPTSLEGIEKYLGSGMVKGIGPHFAKKLVGAFGEQVFDLIETAPKRLTDLEGIGPKRHQRVVEAGAEQ
jgi:exodeoxyribonuclease V alpha subunit